MFNDLFKSLSQVFNKDELEFKSKTAPKSMEKLNETLGNLYYVTRQKQMIMTNALLAPVGVMVGGGLIHVGGGDAPAVRSSSAPAGAAADAGAAAAGAPAGAAGATAAPAAAAATGTAAAGAPAGAAGATAGADAAAPADAASLPSFVAPDKPARAVYSVSKVLANILKRHEDDLKKSFSERQLQEIADLLKATYKKEQEVFETVFMMNELQEHLANGNIDDESVDELKNLVRKARQAHKEQMGETKKTFNKLGIVMVGRGLPRGSVAYLS